jgi:hypothetical protein
VVKNYMADNCDFTMIGMKGNLPMAFAKMTPATCKEIISKIVEQEDKYWHEDEKLDDEYAKNTAEEYAGKIFDEEGTESYLEDL